MTNYQVSFVTRDWVSVNVKAENEEQARRIAQKKLCKVYDRTGVDCNDGKTDYAGITNLDVLDYLN